MPTTIEIALRGCVNGVPVEDVATGELDRARGSLRVELAIARPPLHWDPALGLLAVVDELLLEAVRPGPATVEPADVSFLHHRAVLRDDAQREVGGSVGSVRLDRAKGRLAGEFQFLRARFALESTERATRVEAAAPPVVVPRNAGSVHVATAYAFDTDFGHRYSLLGLVEGERGDGARNALMAVDLSLALDRELTGEGSGIALTARFGATATTGDRS